MPKWYGTANQVDLSSRMAKRLMPDQQSVPGSTPVDRCGWLLGQLGPGVVVVAGGVVVDVVVVGGGVVVVVGGDVPVVVTA